MTPPSAVTSLVLQMVGFRWYKITSWSNTWNMSFSCRLGILRHRKSFFGTPEIQSTYKAFICSFTEYYSPLWAACPASHLTQLDTMETKACKIIEISCDEDESMGTSLRHHRQVGGLCLLLPSFWSCTLCFFSVPCLPLPLSPKFH